MNVIPTVLEGRRVRLEPLTLDHCEPLCEVGLNPELWKITTTLIRSREDMKEYIQTALRWQSERTALPFAIFSKPDSRYVGSTRFANIEHSHRRAEIGWTWIAPAWQRTYVNSEAKLLLLTHAFETLGCIRVEFKTDSLNTKSRNALLRIGATEEGTFRNHMIVPGGRYRHSVYFSVIDSEWPEVKKRLLALIKS